MNMLSEGFPKAQMMVCGVLGTPQQRARSQRVPACALRAQADRCRGPGHGADALTTEPAVLIRTATHHAGHHPALLHGPRWQQPGTDGMAARRRRQGAGHGAHRAWTGRTCGSLQPRGGTAEHLGFAVRSYDQHGHGESDGKPGALPSDTFLLDNLAEHAGHLAPAHGPAPAADPDGPQPGRTGRGTAGVAEPAQGRWAGLVFTRA
jgi:hypothetical protein